jgi:hypothetical protein
MPLVVHEKRVRLVTVRVRLMKRMWLPTSAWRANLIEAIAVVAAVAVVGAVIAATPADGAAVRRSTSTEPAIVADRPAVRAPASSPGPDRFLPSGETAMLVVGCVLMGLGAVLRRREAPDDGEGIGSTR